MNLQEAQRRQELVKKAAVDVRNARANEIAIHRKDMAESDVMTRARVEYGPDADDCGFDLAVERQRRHLDRHPGRL